MTRQVASSNKGMRWPMPGLGTSNACGLKLISSMKLSIPVNQMLPGELMSIYAFFQGKEKMSMKSEGSIIRFLSRK